jgi:hypothetical protein
METSSTKVGASDRITSLPATLRFGGVGQREQQAVRYSSDFGGGIFRLPIRTAAGWVSAITAMTAAE